MGVPHWERGFKPRTASYGRHGAGGTCQPPYHGWQLPPTLEPSFQGFQRDKVYKVGSRSSTGRIGEGRSMCHHWQLELVVPKLHTKGLAPLAPPPFTHMQYHACADVWLIGSAMESSSDPVGLLRSILRTLANWWGSQCFCLQHASCTVKEKKIPGEEQQQRQNAGRRCALLDG